MLTGEGDIDSKVEGFEAGADDYLAKPIDTRELRARVQCAAAIGAARGGSQSDERASRAAGPSMKRSCGGVAPTRW